MALLGLFGASYGCTVQSAPAGSTDPTASSQSAIEGGQSVNESPQPVTYQFSLATVRVTTRSNGLSCTGVILTETKILTAAHCAPDSTSFIYTYDTSSDVSSGLYYPVATNPVAVPQGVVCPNLPYPQFPATTCWATDHGQYADLAIITLAEPISLPNFGVPLGAQGQPVVGSDATWVVGVGDIDGGTLAGGVTNNSDYAMSWVAAILTTRGTNGQLYTKYLYADHGDSGGPIYQTSKTPGAGVGPDNLTIVGIDSGQTPNTATGHGYNLATDVTSQYNYAWIMNQITPPIPNVVLTRGVLDLAPRLSARPANENEILPDLGQ